jgi:hypothetical protein
MSTASSVHTSRVVRPGAAAAPTQAHPAAARSVKLDSGSVTVATVNTALGANRSR